jgi:hypothetical protein
VRAHDPEPDEADHDERRLEDEHDPDEDRDHEVVVGGCSRQDQEVLGVVVDEEVHRPRQKDPVAEGDPGRGEGERA